MNIQISITMNDLLQKLHYVTEVFLYPIDLNITTNSLKIIVLLRLYRTLLYLPNS